ncbi:VOC family protein [Owenweeksia hongkongensis]|uniref:VOC family protein n=1 Tax=Owenweeksia hongkongensis TaxID=253245 RepID=UPI003A90CA13
MVSDLSKSKPFYTDVLGASIFREYGGDSIVLGFLGNWILLVTKGGPTVDKTNTEFLLPIDKNKVSHAFTIRVKDCQNSYELLKARGAKFITPPSTNGAETRCFFHDPDRHLFEISEYSS